jgi:hypothetical protein
MGLCRLLDGVRLDQDRRAAPRRARHGLIAWDQDEILLLWKRGAGLPKPDADKKPGSNHRAPAGRHSSKPAYYRDMINAMTGGVPVLELFAREDDEHVLPREFLHLGQSVEEHGQRQDRRCGGGGQARRADW